MKVRYTAVDCLKASFLLIHRATIVGVIEKQFIAYLANGYMKVTHDYKILPR